MAYLFAVKKGTTEINVETCLDKDLYTKLTLENKLSLNNHIASLYSVDSDDLVSLKNSIHQKVLNHELDFDAFLLDTKINLEEKGVLVMDMDMTTVQIEGIDEIARALGLFDEISKITHEAMQGNMDFKESLRRRVSLLKDKDASVLEHVKKIMVKTDGLDFLIKTLKEHKWYIGIASGGFTQLIDVIKNEFNLDLVHANTLEIKDNKFTGNVVGEIVDAKGKEIALTKFIQDTGVKETQSICIGDGANDLLMIKKANLGVAFRAKSKVQKEVNVCLNHSDLSAIAILLIMMK